MEGPSTWGEGGWTGVSGSLLCGLHGGTEGRGGEGGAMRSRLTRLVGAGRVPWVPRVGSLPTPASFEATSCCTTEVGSARGNMGGIFFQGA